MGAGPSGAEPNERKRLPAQQVAERHTVVSAVLKLPTSNFRLGFGEACALYFGFPRQAELADSVLTQGRLEMPAHYSGSLQQPTPKPS